MESPEQCNRLFKFNDKDTRTMSMTLPWYFYCLFSTYFIRCWGISVVKLKQVNTGWEADDVSINVMPLNIFQSVLIFNLFTIDYEI